MMANILPIQKLVFDLNVSWESVVGNVCPCPNLALEIPNCTCKICYTKIRWLSRHKAR